MHLQFCGAAQTVTGSQCLLKVNGQSLLLECGLYQGKRSEAYERNLNFPFSPASLNAVILTHAHMDHSGNIPNLVKQGFHGPIYCTAPTVDLCQIMLRDSAHVQAHDLNWVNKIRARHGQPPAVPLYSMEEADAALQYFVAKEYDQPFTAVPGVEITLRDAGHILGAATIQADVTEKKYTRHLSFSGDIGRPHMPVTRDPVHVFDPDILVMESTYGNRQHGEFDSVEEELVRAVRETAARGGKVIIPAFALGRTQLLVYLFHKLYNQNRIPEIPIFVDSPLAVQATRIFEKYTDLLDRETDRLFLQSHEDPFKFRQLKYVESTEDSKKLNGLAYPHVIISASGMLEGGRVLHHLRNSIGQHNNLLLLVGYAAKDTLARRLIEGNQTVKIFGEEHEVRCQVKVMDNFSAHADRLDLLDYARRTPPEKLKHIFLVHGEPDQALPLRDALCSSGYQNVHYPALNEGFTL